MKRLNSLQAFVFSSFLSSTPSPFRQNMCRLRRVLKENATRCRVKRRRRRRRSENRKGVFYFIVWLLLLQRNTKQINKVKWSFLKLQFITFTILGLSSFNFSNSITLILRFRVNSSPFCSGCFAAKQNERKVFSSFFPFGYPRGPRVAFFELTRCFSFASHFS